MDEGSATKQAGPPSDALLLGLVRPLTAALPLAAKLRQVLESTRDLLPARHVGAWLLEPDGSLTCVAAFDRARGRALHEAELAAAMPPVPAARLAMQRGYADEHESVSRVEGDVLVVPLWASGAWLGCLCLEPPQEGRDWPPTVSRLAAGVGALVALAVSLERASSEVAALRHNLELLQNVVQDQTDLILRTDRKGRILFANRAALEFAGLSEAEALGRQVYEFAPEGEHAFVTEQNAAISADHPLVRYEHRTVRRDGSIAIMAWLVRGLLEDGKVHEYQAIGRDVTREREQDERMREAQRLESLAVLAGGIAHDFNNLLTPILGYADALRRDLGGEPRQAARVEEIARAAERAQQLVRQILIFGQKDTGAVGLIEVAPALRETLAFLRSSLPSRIQLEVLVDDDCGAVKAQASDVYQLLSNLCTNAYQAMPAGGKLTVSASRVTLRRSEGEVDYCQIIVRDTGHGMDPDVQKRIFEPFFTTKRPGEGTGLGLSMVHGVVTSLGGTIAVQSRPGEGTSFVVLLPSVDPNPIVSRSPGEGARPGHGRVLVVDDEPPVALVLRDLLEELGHKVDVRTTPNDALAAFLRDPDGYGLVITDLTMPRMGGIELAWRVHQARPDLPVLLMTGFGELLTRDDLKAASIVDLIKKPFSIEEVEAIVSRVLEPEASTPGA
jgi:PAS domain S-box-containing protein